MTTAHRAPVASGSGTSLQATFTEAASTFTSSYGLVAMVRRYSSTVDPTPATPANWALIKGPDTPLGGPGVGVWFFGFRGTGAVNSVTITGSSATTVINLVSVPNVKTATFWDTPDASATTSGTSLALGAVTNSEAGATALGMWALGGTAGGTGFSVSGLSTQRSGTSSASTSAWAEQDFPSAGTSISATATWTTAGAAKGVLVSFKTGSTNPAPVANKTRTITQRIDYSASQNTTLLSANVVSGPTGFDNADIAIAGLVATFTDDTTRTVPIVIDFTLTGAGGTVVDQVTIPIGAPTGIVYSVLLSPGGWQ